MLERQNKHEINFQDYRTRNEKLYTENTRLIDNTNDKVFKLSTNFNKIVKELENINEKKASKKALKELSIRLDKFSQLEHMEYL